MKFQFGYSQAHCAFPLLCLGLIPLPHETNTISFSFFPHYNTWLSLSLNINLYLSIFSPSTLSVLPRYFLHPISNPTSFPMGLNILVFSQTTPSSFCYDPSPPVPLFPFHNPFSYSLLFLLLRASENLSLSHSLSFSLTLSFFLISSPSFFLSLTLYLSLLSLSFSFSPLSIILFLCSFFIIYVVYYKIYV